MPHRIGIQRQMMLLPLFLLSLRATSQCDTWCPPTPEHWSANGKFVLAVDSEGETLALNEKRKGDTIRRWSIGLPQEFWVPVKAYITDDGQYVVLRDQWGHVGTGNVLVFLGSKGNVLTQYALEDLLTDWEIMNADITISSLWWSKDGLFFFRRQQTEFAFVTAKGTLRVFDLASGQRVKLSPEEETHAKQDAIARAREELVNSDPCRRSVGVTILELMDDKESIPQAREFLASKDPGKRAAGASLVSVLGDKESVPALTRLLEDRNALRTTTANGRSEPRWYYVQLAAGKALLKLLGGEAVPLLEGKLHSKNRDMIISWIERLSDAGVAASSSTLKTLTDSRIEKVRYAAIIALLKEDDGTLLRANPKWLTDKDKQVRYQAVRLLSEKARDDEAGLLRTALHDTSDWIVTWAMRGLVRLRVPDLIPILQECAKRSDDEEFEAQLELARQGDSVEMERLVELVRSLKTHSDEKKGREWGWINEHIAADDVCEILAEKKPLGAEAVLRDTSENTCLEIQIPVFGALAAMGDSAALERVRSFAHEGRGRNRAQAITWLAVCKDTTSIPSLKDMLKDEDLWVRQAAQSALKRLGEDHAAHKQ